MNMQITSHSLPLINWCYVAVICILQYDWLLFFYYSITQCFNVSLTKSFQNSETALVHKLQQLKVLTFLLRW